MDSRGEKLVVRRTFIEVVGDEDQDDEGGGSGNRLRGWSDPGGKRLSDPSPSFASADTLKSEAGLSFATVDTSRSANEDEDAASDHNPEVPAETQAVVDEDQSSEVLNRSNAQSADRETEEHPELNLLQDHLPETLDNDGEASCKSSTSTRITIKNTFLEVVVDDASNDNISVLGARRHTAPVGPTLSALKPDQEDKQDQMRRADSNPTDRVMKGKGLSGKSDFALGGLVKTDSDCVLTDRPDTVPSERAPVIDTSQGYPIASERKPSKEVDSGMPTDAGSCSMSSGELTVGASASAGENLEEGPKTTIMLRNLPVSFSRDMLLSVVDKEGFAGRYDFVYLPIDFGSRCGFGYAFINLVDADAATEFRAHFQGFSEWGIESPKVADVTWSSTHQGLEEHVSRYRNSPVMHETMPDECKPIVLRDGARVDFPPPTKTLRPPRIRPSKHRGGRNMGSPEECKAEAE